MIGAIKRHSTLLFIACSFGLFLLRLNLGFDYYFSLVGVMVLAAAKIHIDGHGSGTTFYQRMKVKLDETIFSFAALLRLEKNVHFSLVGIFPWKQSSKVVAEPSKEFSFRRTNDYGVIVALLLIGSVVDIPLLHLLVHNFVPDEYRIAAHCGVAFLTTYGLVWIVSDLRAIKASSHSLSDAKFRLQLGWRLSGCIPTASILGAWKAPDSIRRWRIDNNLRRSDISLITPLDAPNVLLEIEERDGQRIFVDFLAMKRRASRYLALYVDAPGELIDRINAQITPKAAE